MGAFARWLERQDADASCCPDPDDMERFEEDGGLPRLDDEAITAHGFDSRFTPVAVLMNGALSMGLQHAHDMEFGDYA